MLWFTAKNFAIFFGLATTAFCISTIVLAVQKADLEDDLQDALDKLDMLTSLVPTQATVPPTTPSPGTPSPGTPSPGTPSPQTPAPGSTPSGPPNPTTPSNPNTPEVPVTNSSPVPLPTVTLPNENPDYPTLPTGLPDPEKIVYRLPTDLFPVRYVLYWHPDLKTQTCQGSVSIQIQAEKETNLIVLHAKNLDIDGISILQMWARMRMLIKSYYLSEERELLIIELEELLYTDIAYTVSIDFRCNLKGLKGMYASSYLNENSIERWIATSKFEPTFARQAFPCFDEPAMKATFTITVVRPTGDGYHALSNMNVKSENKLNDDETEVNFAESVPMSTYLACFIVSDFAHKTATVRGTIENSNDFEMRVFSTAAQVDKVQYALDTGVGITEYYIDFFQVPYPLPKLDMAAIPDFVSGAMEHWGLVTYRETALLYSAQSSSSANKQRVATVVAHELAHMWFGNLVTMKWWNDLWLNEGFASYIEYKGVHHMHPEWQMLDQFIIEDLHGVMKLDATLASHPIVQTVESPNQITELFDSITYSKGASVIRMLENFVGENTFRAATTSYLTKFAETNAETRDFLTEMEAQSNNGDIILFMQTWTEQMGFPVVEVIQDGNTYKLTQKQFLSNPEDYNAQLPESSFNYHWTIPVTYFTSTNPDVQSAIFNYNDNELTVTLTAEVDWIKFNKNQFGYYRVNYSPEMWQKLKSALVNNRAQFSVSDRGHLMSDVFALADASQLSYDIALDMTVYLEKELDYVPWSVATSRLNAIKNLLYYTNLYRDFVVYGRKLLNTAYEAVKWDVGNNHLENLLRVNILGSACAFGNENALQEASRRFTTWLSNPSVRPEPDIRTTVYYYGMQTVGTEGVWDQVWELFIAEQDAQEKVKLMQALAAIKEPWILQRYINNAWNENYVRGQDYFSCLQYIAQNRIGQSLVWDYVRENWPRLVERFGINERNLGRLIPGITARFTTTTKEEEMQAFFAKYPEAGAGTAARKEALETVKYNIKWLQQNKNQVGTWLEKQKNGDETTTTTTETNRIN